MKIPGGNHLDRRRRLLPRDYAVDPHKFGEGPLLRFQLPTDGDQVSARLAILQHRLVIAWRQSGGPSGAEMARRYRFSRQTWHRIIRGGRWAGETGLAALLEAGRTPAAKDGRCPTHLRPP